MTPRELQLYNSVLSGEFRTLSNTISPSHLKHRMKSGLLLGIEEVVKIMAEFDKFIQDPEIKNFTLPYCGSKKLLKQIYDVASLFKLKKDNFGQGKKITPIFFKSNKSTTPTHFILAKYLQLIVDHPQNNKLKDIEKEISPIKNNNNNNHQDKRDKDQRDKYVAQHAKPVGEDNIGNIILRNMGWTGGGLGAKGEGIQEPISQIIKFSRSGLG